MSDARQLRDVVIALGHLCERCASADRLRGYGYCLVCLLQPPVFDRVFPGVREAVEMARQVGDLARQAAERDDDGGALYWRTS